MLIDVLEEAFDMMEHDLLCSVRRLLADVDNDKSSVFSNVIDPYLDMTKKQLQTMAGVQLC